MSWPASTPLTLEPLVEVRLYHHLGREFGRVHRLAVKSAAEAVHALMTLYPRFRKAVLERERYRVLIGRGERRHAIGEEALTLNVGSADCIRIVPVIEGAKSRGFGQVVKGVVLLVAAAVFYAVGIVYEQPWAISLGHTLETAGWAMIIGGVMQMLSPQHKSDTGDKKSTASYFMDGPVNVTEQGGPVPLIIGRTIVGSTVVSSGLHADDISPAPPPAQDPPDLPYDQDNGDYDPNAPGNDAWGGHGS